MLQTLLGLGIGDSGKCVHLEPRLLSMYVQTEASSGCALGAAMPSRHTLSHVALGRRNVPLSVSCLC